MIAVQGDGSEVILVEGNTRATAYVLRGVPTEIDMLLGSSAGIRQWAFY
jgi:hypothetical protein